MNNIQKAWAQYDEDNEYVTYILPQDMYEGWYFQPLEEKFYNKGIRFVDDEYEADIIQEQYSCAISRTSNYVCQTLNYHLLNGNAHVLDLLNTGDYVCGIEKADCFIISHFAPRTIKSGVKMLKALATCDIPVIVATLPYQANQLRKAGFRKVANIPQFWDGEIVTKEVMVNDSVTMYHLVDILSEISEE